jgi:transcriptional regulator PpsR
MKVVDANPAAARALGAQPRELVGRLFELGAAPADRDALRQHLESVRAGGEGEPVRVAAGDGGEWDVQGALLRQEGAPLFLLRISPAGTAAARGDGSRVVRALQASPDGFVLTDAQGKVLAANPAFLELVEVPAEGRAVGESLSRWIGRPGADVDVLLGTIREHGAARLFSTAVRGELGFTSEVEISAAASTGADACIGLTVRDVGRRLSSGPSGARDLTRAVEHLTQLVGKVSLRDLIRDTTDLVERHFIEAALELTQDNRSSAAEVLGVSRQSLYVKLRRYGHELKDSK